MSKKAVLKDKLPFQFQGLRRPLRGGRAFPPSPSLVTSLVMRSKSKADVEFQYGGRLGEFNGMSSQSHISHCMVLPLDEFTVTIPEPHAALQGAVTWRNQCHDRATLQGVRILSAILKIVFAIFYFL